jgi:hypothetical protein
MKFDLTDLRLFCEIIDAGSITARSEAPWPWRPPPPG